MRSSQSQSLSRSLFSSAISYALMLLLCAPFLSVVASSKAIAGAKHNAITAAPAAQAQKTQSSGEPIDVNALASLSLDNRRELKSTGLMKTGANKLFRYGLDKDNVPFAQRADGTKGRFVNLTPNHLKLQIARGQRHGEVEFVRLSDAETITQFKIEGGYSLFVSTVTKRAQTARPESIWAFSTRTTESPSTSMMKALRKVLLLARRRNCGRCSPMSARIAASRN
jgi:hypothetical protein